MKNYASIILCLFITTLTGCGSSNVVRFNLGPSHNSIELAKDKLTDICKGLYDDGFVEKRDTYQDEILVESRLLCTHPKAGYLGKFLYLDIEFRDLNRKTIAWGYPSKSHLGTRLGNSSFPKWYCEEYISVYRQIKEDFNIEHDPNMKNGCKLSANEI